MKASPTTIRTQALRGLAAVGLCALGAVAHAAPDPMTNATGGNLSGSDRTFVTKAAIGGMTEIQASTVAKDKATNPAIKDFAGRMITDHTKAGNDLTKIATAESVTPPGELDKSHKSDVDKLSQKSGADFDKAYMKMMVSDHKSTISLFEKEAKSGNDAQLKSFAGTTLPTLQEHLKMAQDIDKTL